MKIKLKNWGPVSECEFDLDKSLIVIYGNNNIGKSYAMQTIYLLLKNLILYAQNIVHYSNGLYLYFVSSGKKISSSAKNILVAFIQNQQPEQIVDIDLLSIVSKELEGEFLDQLYLSFENSFGTFEEILKKNPEFTIETSHSSCHIDLAKRIVHLNQDFKSVRLKTSTSDFHKHREDKNYYTIYVCDQKINTPSELLEERVAEIKKLFALDILHKVQAVYYLPASRSGIYAGMSSFSPILALLAQNRSSIRGSIQIPSISEPISDYYMALSTIKENAHDDFKDCTDEIEQNILNGDVQFDFNRKTILYHPAGTDLSLEMNDASSMVSEIAPIIAFLKYIITGLNRTTHSKLKKLNKNSILFIEEPEAHLHPANQISLLKSFVKLSHLNVQLIMASHSNYIFNQLNNMVMDQQLDQTSYLPILMREQNHTTISEYMNMDEFGVDDENFADVSSQLMEERDEIIARILEKTEDHPEE